MLDKCTLLCIGLLHAVFGYPKSNFAGRIFVCFPQGRASSEMRILVFSKHIKKKYVIKSFLFKIQCYSFRTMVQLSKLKIFLAEQDIFICRKELLRSTFTWKNMQNDPDPPLISNLKEKDIFQVIIVSTPPKLRGFSQFQN